MAEESFRMGHRVAMTAVAMIAAALVILAFSSTASADVSFCTLGTGAGQCFKPGGVAVDTSSGETGSENVYVVDRGNNRINVFDPEGHFLFAFGWGVDASSSEAKLQTCTTVTGCIAGIAGAGAGQFSGPKTIAVDNEPGSASRHDVYVFDSGNFRVEKFDSEGHFLTSFGSQGSGSGQFSRVFDPLAVGPGGTVYVGDTVGEASPRVEKFTPAGSFIGAIALPVTSIVLNLAVDASGDLYGAFGGGEGLYKFGPSGEMIFNIEAGHGVSSLSIAGDGDLYASQVQPTTLPSSSGRAVTRFEPDGTIVKRFGYGHLVFSTEGLAAYTSADGDLFASEENTNSPTDGNRVVYLKLPQPGPIPVPASLGAAPVGNTKATLNAEVNPEGKPTTVHFEYITEDDYQADGGSFGSGTVTTPSISLGGEDFELHYKAAAIGCSNPVAEAGEAGKCLLPETKYRFRVVASSSEGTSTVEGTPFETAPPLGIEATWSTQVGTDAALLHGEVDPHGIPTTGYFEYVDDASFQESGFADATRVPAEGAGPLDFGAGEDVVERTGTLIGLSSGTTYHYRLVATDPLIEPSPGPVVGPERILRTFLPSSQPGGCPNESLRPGLAAFLPDCRAYEMVSPLEKENGDVLTINEPISRKPAALDESSLSGDRLTYSSYRAFAEPESAPYSSQYIAVRGPEGWENHSISPPKGTLDLTVSASLDTEFKAFSPDLCESWLRTISEPPLTATAVPHYVNLYRRADPECGGTGYEALTPVAPPHKAPSEYATLELQGVSADGSSAIYVAPDKLTPEAPEVSGTLLYEWAEGDLHFVCVLPNGHSVSSSCSAGGVPPLSSSVGSHSMNVSNAFSADGSHIYWASSGKIYLRVNPARPQSGISAGECTEPEAACTLPVSAQAEALSHTSSSLFWGAASDGSRAIFTTGQDLYEYDAASGEDKLISHNVYGVSGMSEDAAWVYFPSREVLAGANPRGQSPASGSPNLYLYHEGHYVFIGTLAGADVVNEVGGGRYATLNAGQPRFRTAEVSPDGRHFAFMSAASLTGYDNIDANSDEADAEVFVFDATAEGGAGSIACASCDPTGGRPVGTVVNDNVVIRPVAATLPTWENTLYVPRALSPDGSRVFFQAPGALSVRDTNGVGDVYEWEQAGTGSCDAASPSYSAGDGGCLELISSGQGAHASEFVDASPDGSNVFFTTLASLVPQDYGLIDVYDARIDGGFPVPPAQPASCEGEACQPAPQAPESRTPASASLYGAGNVTEPQKVHCPKGKVKKHGKCVKKAAKSKGKNQRKHRAKHTSGGKG